MSDFLKMKISMFFVLIFSFRLGWYTAWSPNDLDESQRFTSTMSICVVHDVTPDRLAPADPRASIDNKSRFRRNDHRRRVLNVFRSLYRTAVNRGAAEAVTERTFRSSGRRRRPRPRYLAAQRVARVYAGRDTVVAVVRGGTRHGIYVLRVCCAARPGTSYRPHKDYILYAATITNKRALCIYTGCSKSLETSCSYLT